MLAAAGRPAPPLIIYLALAAVTALTSRPARLSAPGWHCRYLLRALTLLRVLHGKAVPSALVSVQSSTATAAVQVGRSEPAAAPPRVPAIMEAPRGAEAKKKPQHLEGDELYKALIAGSVGNFLEWFDFALYGMFANEIAAVSLSFPNCPPRPATLPSRLPVPLTTRRLQTFFPAGEASTQLLESFAVFAGAFVMRPVGGVLFGYIGDKYGRVYSMRLAMSLMAVPTTAIAILPGYETLGPFLCYIANFWRNR